MGSQREQGAIQEFPNVPGIPSASSALVVCRFVWAFYSAQDQRHRKLSAGQKC